MNRIKVVQFIHGFTTGGAENLVKQYCLLLDKEKIDLLVVALHNHHSVFDLELAKSGIRVVYIDDMIDKKFLLFPAVIQKAMHRIYRKDYVRKVIRSFAPDVIHYHILLSDYVRYINPQKDVKLFLTIHSDPRQLWNRKRQSQKDKRDTEWLASHCCFQFIALHEKMRIEINEMFGVDDTIIIKNGVIADMYQMTKPKEQTRGELGLPGDATVIGHIGRFIEAKNHKFLVEVFERYLNMNSDAVLILIGVGILQDSIKEIVKKKGLEQRVSFLGTRADIPEILHAMDAMIFPSIYEGMPVTLIEAQFSGVPCLVSDKVTEEVKISNMLCFESLEHSADAWAKALDRMICNAMQPVINSIEWDLRHIVRDLEDLYVN